VQRARGVRIARERWAAEEPETRQMVADEYAHAALWRARGTTHMSRETLVAGFDQNWSILASSQCIFREILVTGFDQGLRTLASLQC
jgi:nuclear transport factor 2 (NTF2) superfamily protein